jgi:hypothetical protein
MRGGEQHVKQSLMIVYQASKEQRCCVSSGCLQARSCITHCCFIVERCAPDVTPRGRRCKMTSIGVGIDIGACKVSSVRACRVVPFGRPPWFRCCTPSGTPYAVGAVAVSAGLRDPEARLREPLRAAARAAARALGTHSILELETTGDATRRRLPQLLALPSEAAAQLVERIGQDLLGHAELAR